MAAKRRISILVPVWNDVGVLCRCLDSLVLEMQQCRHVTELIVIAGGSDGTYETALAWRSRQDWAKVTVLQQSPRGKNAALNDGIALAEGDILVFVDADTQVLPNWLTELVLPVVGGEAAATTAQFRPFRHTPVSNVFTIEQFNAQVVAGEGALFGGGTIAVSRDALSEIGGLPENVLVGVDWDLTRRLRRAGFRTQFVPSAGVYTEISESWRLFWRGEVRWRRAWWVLQRHNRKTRIMALYTLAIRAALLASVIGLAARVLLPQRVVQDTFIAALAIMVWTLGPYAVRVAEYAAAMRAWPRPSDLWAYFAAVFVSSLALIVGITTIGRLSPHFKGQRTGRVTS